MKTKLLLVTTIAASVLFSNAVFAFGDMIIQQPPQSAAPGSHFLENVPVKQNPLDDGHLNESPIRGKGAIKVVHNEPAPGDSAAEITKALWLLKDNGLQCYKPNDRRR